MFLKNSGTQRIASADAGRVLAVRPGFAVVLGAAVLPCCGTEEGYYDNL